MKWVTVENEHINMDLVKHFEWRGGRLFIWFLNDREPTVFVDIEKKLYASLLEEFYA